ncbi:TPA: hypothetical protein ACF3CV_002461 [Enterococcus faecium]|uniref:hypothetical protein n=1 Tax=Enterococcus sp. E5-162 TaxID=3002979 RepID=UPI002D7E8C67|nr:hypothetical protein [Enterococcus sp. E5-162]MEB4751524.1 hypothetical protein [Enterococcus sp. E5-162]NTQ98375.1 hypothetical protein [Enterococcus faecium]
MTNGTSQGLFIVVAIIILGIFIAISYLLFRNTLKPSLSTIYCDSFEQIDENTNLLDTNNSKCMRKFNNSFEVKGYFNIWFKGANWGPIIWTPDNTEIRTIKLSQASNGIPTIENGYVLVDSISDINVAVKQDAIDKGFGTNKTREAYISINGEKEIYLGKANSSNVSWGINKGLKLKIGEVNTIKMKYINVHGGKTVYTLQVIILN